MEGAVGRRRTWGARCNFLKDGFRNWKSSSWQDKYAKAYAPIASVAKTIQGMSESVGSDGGFAVLPEYSHSLLEKVYENDLLSRTDNYTVVGNNMTFPRSNETSRATGQRAGGLQAYWTGEGAGIPQSKPALGQLALKLKKLAIVVYLTDELIDDAGIALEQYVTRKVAQEFNFMVGDAIFEGTGGGQPQGILNSGALLVVAKQTGQAAGTVVKENLDGMYARLWAGSVPSSVWLMNQDVWPAIFGLNQAVGSGRLPDVHRTGRVRPGPQRHDPGPPRGPRRVRPDAGNAGRHRAGRPQPVHHDHQGGHRPGAVDPRRIPHRPARLAVHSAGRRRDVGEQPRHAVPRLQHAVELRRPGHAVLTLLVRKRRRCRFRNRELNIRTFHFERTMDLVNHEFGEVASIQMGLLQGTQLDAAANGGLWVSLRDYYKAVVLIETSGGTAATTL